MDKLVSFNMLFEILILSLFLSPLVTAIDIPAPFTCGALDCIIRNDSKHRDNVLDCMQDVVGANSTPSTSTYLGHTFGLSPYGPSFAARNYSSWTVGVSTHLSPDGNTLEIEKSYILAEAKPTMLYTVDDIGCAVFFKGVKPIDERLESACTSGNHGGCYAWLNNTVSALIEEGTRGDQSMDCGDLEEALKKVVVDEACDSINEKGKTWSDIHVESK